MMEGAQGELFDFWRLGQAAKRRAASLLRTMVAETTIAPEVLQRYVEEVGQYKVNEEWLGDALRVGYMRASRSVDFVLPEFPNPRFRIRPNETKRKFARAYRRCIENISKEYSEIDPVVFEWQDPWGRGKLALARAFLSGNIHGDTLVGLSAKLLEKAPVEKCRDNVIIAATQLLIALKCHKTVTGQLPRSLDELVPEYLSEVPVDDFDGKPMKYSQEERKVFSVGAGTRDYAYADYARPTKENLTFSIDF